MPIITQTDLGTHLYPEIIDEITRTDNTIVDKAIDTAIQEAKMYLGRYDLVQLFGTDTTAPTIDDAYLKGLVKDLACWHLVRLATVNVDYNAFRNNYFDAINALKTIMKGGAEPEGWPYKDTSADIYTDGDSINWNSNLKRENYF